MDAPRPAHRLIRLAGIVLAVAVVRCAHVEAPSGGPVDTRPPAVAAVYPAPGTRNVPLDAPVVFQFTEWIDRNAARNKVFISPPLRGKLRVTVDGDKLQVTPSEAAAGFRPNTSYQVTVLPSLVDLHGVTAGRAFSLRFSTGATFDSASVSGSAVSETPQASFLAALYPVGASRRGAAIEPISLRETAFTAGSAPEPWRELPAFLAAADSSGRFRFDSVAQGDYALLAFEDVNGNFAFDLGLESAAVGPLDLTLRPRAAGQSLRAARLDTLALRIVGASFLPDSTADSTQVPGSVKIEFSRPPHPLLAAEAARYRILGPAGEALPVASAAWNPARDGWILETPPLRAGTEYRVEMRARPDFPGRNGAGLADTSVSFTADAARDSATWTLSFAGPSAATGLTRVAVHAAPGSEFTVVSSRALSPARWNRLQQGLEARIDTTPAPRTLTRLNHFSFLLRLSRPLAAPQGLTLRLLPPPGDTLAPLELGALRGLDSAAAGGVRFSVPERWSGWKFRLDAMEGNASYALADVSRTVAGALEINALPVGRYRLFAFRDDDGDGVWNPGALKPWIPQEPQVLAMDSVVVRSGPAADVTERLRE